MHARDSTGLGTTGVYPLLPNPFLVSRNLSSWWPRIKLRGGGRSHAESSKDRRPIWTKKVYSMALTREAGLNNSYFGSYDFHRLQCCVKLSEKSRIGWLLIGWPCFERLHQVWANTNNSILCVLFLQCSMDNSLRIENKSEQGAG